MLHLSESLGQTRNEQASEAALEALLPGRWPALPASSPSSPHSTLSCLTGTENLDFLGQFSF